MKKALIRKVNTPLGQIEYQLEFKSVKNINLRVKADGGIYVSAPPYVSAELIEGFLIRRADFIFAALERFESSDEKNIPEFRFGEGDTVYILNRKFTLDIQAGLKNEVLFSNDRIVMRLKDFNNNELRKKVFGKFFDSLCLKYFSGLMDETYPLFKAMGVSIPQLKIRNMKSRWGSCMPGKGIITLNKKLLCAPEECIRYVIMHEYCHFIHPDHSPAFHALMTELMPDWKARKKLLAQCSQYWF